MSTTSPSSADAGYTLVELLVVLLLAGFIGAAVAGGLQFGTRIWEHSESDIARAQSYDSAQAILREVLSSATPRLRKGFVNFRGDPTSLTFDGPPPSAFLNAGLARFEVSVDRGAGGRRLMLKATSLIDSGNSRTATLADHLAGLEFSYLDASEKIPVWLAFWRDRDRMPDAVRIEEDGRTEAAAWPSFVVRLPIAQDATCNFDPVSADCRKL